MARVKRFELMFLGALLTYSVLIFIELQKRQPNLVRKDSKKPSSALNHAESRVSPPNNSKNVRPIDKDSKMDRPNSYLQKVNNGFSEEDVYKTPTNLCSIVPSTLLGRILVNITYLKSLNISDEDFFNMTSNASRKNMVNFGGWWRPKDCVPRAKVAFLIPYRNRPEQLSVFLRHMHPIFQRQQLDYRVFVVEQAGKTSFNKGAIYNIGFNSTFKYDDYDCYIFHDVDLLCENDYNYYGCAVSPLHMSVAIDKFNYRQPYKFLFGGIQAFKKDHYIFTNGYSNRFWGWGAEDDNLRLRVEGRGFKITRPDPEIGRYTMNQEAHYRSDPWNQINARMLRTRLRMATDGLNNINTLKFTITETERNLYTLISIDLTKT